MFCYASVRGSIHMVIIDKMKLPPKRIMFAMLALFLLLILTVAGYFYKQKQTDKSAALAKQQVVQKEKTERSSYDTTLGKIFSSPNISSLKSLYNKLLQDFNFMKGAGWDNTEVLCNVNSCNVRFKRIEGRVFEYVLLKKGTESYVPIFNQDEMTYKDVKYDINLEANQMYVDKTNEIMSCTTFISKTYQLNILLGNSNKQQLSISMPSKAFVLSKEYDWAKLFAIKKGKLTYNSDKFFTVNYIQDMFDGQVLVFDKLTLDKNILGLTLSFYCF